MTKEEIDKIQRIYEIYEQPMYRIAFAVLKNSSYAEDAVSDAFASIIKKIDRIGEPCSPKTKSYIVKIVRNKAIDSYRKNKRIYEKILPIDEETVLIPDGSINIENDVLSGEFDTTGDILDILSDTDRQIIVLRCSENLSWKQIAARLSLKESNVRKRFERVKRRIILMKGDRYYEEDKASFSKRMG